ncbi:MAG TPA: pyridoxamine 5'-phosphate oxidase family protein [Polyangiaceae bacterium]
MNSINQNQPEDVFENLYGKDAVEKIRALATKVKTCLFCTDIRTGKPFATRPMAVQRIDVAGAFYFMSATDSHTNQHIAAHPEVQLLFQGSSYSDFLTLYGRAGITTDKLIIKDLWDPSMKDWFTEGVDDPRCSVLIFRPTEGYYWDTKHGAAVAFAKRLVGAAIGKTLDDSIEGKLQP